MSNLQAHWNANVSTIPSDKDHSAYAIDRAKLFPKAAVVCDLGGGNGVDGLFFANLGHEVKLVDISDQGLRIAQERAIASGAKLDTYHCDLGAGAIPLVDKSCDIVFSRLALHYFRPPVLTQLFSEIYRILRTGGHAYLTLKSPDDSIEMDFLKSTSHQTEPGVFEENGLINTRFAIVNLEEMLRQAKITGFHVAPYTESFAGRKGQVKPAKSELLLNEVQILRAV